MNNSIVGTASAVIAIAAIVVLISARREPDLERQRTFTRYVDSVCLLSAFVALFAVYSAVSQLCRFIIDERYRRGGPSFLDQVQGSFRFGNERLGSINDEIWRSVVQGLLIALAAGIVWFFHARQRRAMRSWSGFEASAGARVDLAFRYAVCFSAAFIVLMALAFGAYGIFRAAAPGVFTSSGGTGQSQRGIAQALSLFFLAAGALAIFRAHWTDSMRVKAPEPEIPLAEVSE